MGQKLSAGDTGSPKAPAELGHGLLKEFQFAEGWRNLNHGAYSRLSCFTIGQGYLPTL
jgi:hypothetical protein